jgi:hypothetical protein
VGLNLHWNLIPRLKNFGRIPLLAFLCFHSVKSNADMNLNSSEPACDGSDANVLLCDDFEDGDWYGKNCDAANASGGLLQTDGWCGTIYFPITPLGAAECGAKGVAGTNCAATSGYLDGHSGNGNMADHGFVGGQKVQEFYARWYYKASPGFAWSGQKVVTINEQVGSGGIFWGGFGFNCGSSGPSTNSPRISMGEQGSDCPTQNVGNDIQVQSGRWYAFQIHVKLNTPGRSDGISEFYIDDCGTNGLACTGTPTVRHRRTGVNWGKTAPGSTGTYTDGGVGALWFENWSNGGYYYDPATSTTYCNGGTPNNCGSKGQEWYDQIKVAKIGPIGFTGSGAPVPIGDSTAPVVTITSPANGAAVKIN